MIHSLHAVVPSVETRSPGVPDTLAGHDVDAVEAVAKP
jgi:hypothetical protein